MTTPVHKEFLGSGIAFPYRIGPQGLPDLLFAAGEDLVDDVIGFLLLTKPGELPWDPVVGIDPEMMRLNPTSDREAAQNARRLESVLIDAEPRIADASVTIEQFPSRERSEPRISYTVIESPTRSNDVRLPVRSQQDVLREVPNVRVPIQGFADALSIGIPGLGQTGNQ
jgi:hypothetical protein